jgi:hypothetical protein
MNGKLVIAAFAVLLLALGGLAVYWVVGDADLGTRSPAAGDAATARVPDAAASGTLSPAEAGSIQARLDRLEVSERTRAALSGSVDRPWPEARTVQAFRSCMERLPGTGLLEDDAPATQERICACVTRSLQQGFPGGPPTGAKAGRILGKAELEAIEDCIR